MHSSIQQIRKKLFLMRDGANTDSMRKKGIDYKMILGVPAVTLRKIAKDYAPDAELADALWKEDHRELKILATLIQNPDSFVDATNWMNEIKNPELAEQATANLFCKLPDAGRLAKEWTQATGLYSRMTGFLLYTRLFIQGFQLGDDTEAYFHVLYHALNDDSSLLRNAAVNSLKRLGRQSVIQAKDILARFEAAPFYDDLKFEFEYYS